MLIFHTTTDEAAAAILEGGFRDGTGYYLTANKHTGVWVSASVLDENEGAQGDRVLVLDVPEEVLAAWEWIEEGKGYREFLVPAKVLNQYSILHHLDWYDALDLQEEALREAGGATGDQR